MIQILLIQKATTTPQFSFLTTLINYATADLSTTDNSYTAKIKLSVSNIFQKVFW